jgi:5-(carboxyamino)imidazole ribonucleotide synthase
VVTFDWENVPAEALQRLAQRTRSRRRRGAGHRAGSAAEKELFARLGIPPTAIAAVDSRDDLRRAAAEIGLPGVLKTRRLGYDGKGQQVIRGDKDIEPRGGAGRTHRG